MPNRPGVIGTIAAHAGIQPETHWCWCRDLVSLSTQFQFSQAKWHADAYIPRARSRALTDWYEQSDAEVYFWVDSDIAWEPGSIQRLIATTLDRRGVVAGVVPKRFFGAGIACRISDDVRGFDTGTDAVYRADFCGAAFMAIHRDVVDTLAPTLPLITAGRYQYQPFCSPETIDCAEFPGLKEDLSEDWALCWRWREAGGKCWVDAMPVCQHKGAHLFTVDDACCGRGDA